MPGPRSSSLFSAFRAWIGSRDALEKPSPRGDRVEWLRVLPFLALHLGCAAVIWVGWSPTAVIVAVGLYLVRMFAITGGYHRYFSHRTFRTSRPVQFAMALLGNASVQRGPLWWAAHHRHHHRHSDEPSDPHSPLVHGLLWSHVGWITTRENYAVRTELIPDLLRYPELRFLDRHDTLVPLGLGLGLFAAGEALAAGWPGLATSGWQLVVWGFCISTVALYHATFTINSLAHLLGGRRFSTADDSRNNPWLALITLGEGWHNNHHHYPHSVRQGFRWWELDLTYLGLRALAAVGLVWDLKPVPVQLRASRRARLRAARELRAR